MANGRRVAIIQFHPAPYREPVASRLFGREGLDVSLFNLFGEDYGHSRMGLGTDGGPISRSPTMHPRGFSAVRLAWRLIFGFALNRKYDFILWPAYAPLWLTVPLLICAMFGRNYAIALDTVRESGGRRSRRIKAFLLRHAQFLWVPGKASRNYLVENYGVPAETIVIGQYLPEFKSVKNPARDSAEPVFLMVANNTPSRRLDALAEGFRKYVAKGGCGRIVLCGRGVGGFGGGAVEAIDGLPWPELPSLYARADVYVHNGDEQFSTALLMGAMSGHPLVASAQVGVCADLFDESAKIQSGILVDDYASSDAWAAAFAAITAKRDEWPDMASAAKARAAIFNPDAVADEIAARILGRAQPRMASVAGTR